MQLFIRHTTHYRFEQPVAHGMQQLRLKPRSGPGQSVIDWSMTLDGARVEVEYDDQNDNCTMLVSTLPGMTEVTISCRGQVDTSDPAGIFGSHSGAMPLWLFHSQTRLTEPGPRMRLLAAKFRSGSPDRLDMLHQLSATVLAAVRYETGHTTATTPAEQALAAGRGVCQDHAHIFIGCARLLGVPARYVSGYLMMNDCVDQEAGHGWAEAYIDSLGWVGFDVSNGISPDQRYVRVATGRDYRDAAPVTGIFYGAGAHLLQVSLAVAQQSSQQ